jgi:hypothetical protein
MKRPVRKWTRKRWRDWERMILAIKKSNIEQATKYNPWAIANVVSKGKTWKKRHKEGRGKKISLSEFKRS